MQPTHSTPLAVQCIGAAVSDVPSIRFQAHGGHPRLLEGKPDSSRTVFRLLPDPLRGLRFLEASGAVLGRSVLRLVRWLLFCLFSPLLAAESVSSREGLMELMEARANSEARSTTSPKHSGVSIANIRHGMPTRSFLSPSCNTNFQELFGGQRTMHPTKCTSSAQRWFGS